MRTIAAIVVSCQLLALSTSGAQASPYTATVAADNACARSGPGQTYYATEKLKRGEQVEVYRRDPVGWCAIRPNKGSFTWVAARYLKPTEDDLAVVTAEEVEARVGSHLSNACDVIQVRLHKGEIVQVLDPQPGGGDQGQRDWVKISPPAGEFRWVAEKDLAQQPAVSSQIALDPKYEAELDRVDLELSIMLAQEPAQWSFDTLRRRTDSLLEQANTAAARGRARALAEKIARFDDLRQRQEAVALMRDQTDHRARLLTAIAQSKTTTPIAVGYEKRTSLSSRENRAGQQPRDSRSATPRDGESPAVDAGLDGRYDGVGRLTQLSSAKPGVPRYALTDGSGGLQCYVTPAPGVRIQDYVGRRVGVNGTRGFMPERHTSHIMARHITPLQETTLR